MMHFFEHPEHAQYNAEPLLPLIPKRVGGPLPNTETVTWGIRAVDGLSLAAVLVLAGIYLLASFFFISIWLVTHPGAVQDAFAPPAYILAFVGVLLVLPQVLESLERKQHVD